MQYRRLSGVTLDIFRFELSPVSAFMDNFRTFFEGVRTVNLASLHLQIYFDSSVALALCRCLNDCKWLQFGRNSFYPEKIYHKLKFGMMTQKHVLSHQKIKTCFGHGTSPFIGL